MTASSRNPWLTDRSDQAPPRKSATSHPGQQAPYNYPTPQPAPGLQPTKCLTRSYPATGTTLGRANQVD